MLGILHCNILKIVPRDRKEKMGAEKGRKRQRSPSGLKIQETEENGDL